MDFQVGQLVQCKAAMIPPHQKLVGCIGEIKIRLSFIESLFYGCEYVVFFPNYPTGQCPYCSKTHDPLNWMMFGLELKRIEDPDEGNADTELPEGMDA